MFMVLTKVGVVPEEQTVLVNTDAIAMVSVLTRQGEQPGARIALKGQAEPLEVVESIKFVFKEITRNKGSR